MSALSAGKRLAKLSLGALGVELRRIRPKSGPGASLHSNFNEEAIIRDLLGKIRPDSRYCVDIGAGDGETMSNSYSLFKAGWQGTAAEWDGARFARMAYRYSAFPGARLVRARITPDNVLAFLAACEAPREFGFLNLDIDGYDHFVLAKLLSAHRPALICAEINEKIPPPLRFAVKWDPEHAWTRDHFFGQSLSMLEELGKREGYDVAGLEYNNAFLVAKELNPGPALTASEAYRAGYADRPDRLLRLPWNRDMEPLLSMPAAEAAAFIREKFKGYAGKYVLE